MKSVALSAFSLVCIVLFTLVFVLGWVSLESVEFPGRRAMAGDQETAVVLNEWHKKNKPKTESEDFSEFERPVSDDKPQGGGDNTVIWIDIPGFRNDYIEKAPAAFLKTMADEGGQTTRMRPNFPPLDFPAHATMATGATVDVHGIPSDSFRVNGQVVNRPDDPSLLKAEPIWETATRQGMPTLVHDWPFSFKQVSGNKAAYFLDQHDPALTDEQRLNRLWDAWVAHRGEKKLRLLMCRLDDIFKAAMEHGHQDSATHDVVKKTDAAIQSFLDKAKAAWPNLRGTPDGNLVVLIGTDHGMVDVEKMINLKMLLGQQMLEKMDTISHDSIAHLYFKNMPASAAEADLEKNTIDSELKKKTYFKTYKQEDFPSEWKYSSSDGRIGDRVLVLKTGFVFSDFAAKEAIFDPSEASAGSAAFGYPVEDAIRMSGQVIVWGFPQQPGYSDLGEIDQTVFHSTVCKLLKIQKSDKAVDKAMSLRF